MSNSGLKVRPVFYWLAAPLALLLSIFYLLTSIMNSWLLATPSARPENLRATQLSLVASVLFAGVSVWLVVLGVRAKRSAQKHKAGLDSADIE